MYTIPQRFVRGKLLESYVSVHNVPRLYRVFTSNSGKVTYYISGTIAHKFLKFLYLDYHNWTYITTNFQYHSRLFHIRKTS